MKTTRIVSSIASVALLVVLFALNGCCHVGQQSPIAGKDITVDEVVKQVQTALARVQPQLTAKHLPPLKAVKLSLATAEKLTASGELDVVVVTAKGSYEKDLTQELDITLSPPMPKPGASHEAFANITDELAKAIATAVKDLKKTYEDDKVALEVSEIDVQIGFAITVDGSLDVGFTLSPVKGTVGGEINHSATHTITIVYGGS